MRCLIVPFLAAMMLGCEPGITYIGPFDENLDAGPDACAEDGGTDGGCDDGGTQGGSGGGGGSGGSGSSAKSCPGKCVRSAVGTWWGPVLVWLGPTSDVPQCPPDMPDESFNAHADLEPPPDCPACACEPPHGTCFPPTDIEAYPLVCYQLNQNPPNMSFDPPVNWDGSCSTTNAIPPNELCNGVPCVRSVTIGPVGMQENPSCAVTKPQTIPQGGFEPVWGTTGRGCKRTGDSKYGQCEDLTFDCLPSIEGLPGFKYCVYKDSPNEQCPVDRGYVEKHSLFEAIDNTLSCTECTCGAPEGSKCTAPVSIYTDSTCSSWIGGTTATSDGPSCIDLPSGSALGSKDMKNLAYVPGACSPSGGEHTGSFEPVEEWTICCIP